MNYEISFYFDSLDHTRRCDHTVLPADDDAPMEVQHFATEMLTALCRDERFLEDSGLVTADGIPIDVYVDAYISDGIVCLRFFNWLFDNIPNWGADEQLILIPATSISSVDAATVAEGLPPYAGPSREGLRKLIETEQARPTPRHVLFQLPIVKRFTAGERDVFMQIVRAIIRSVEQGRLTLQKPTDVEDAILSVA